MTSGQIARVLALWIATTLGYSASIGLVDGLAVWIIYSAHMFTIFAGLAYVIYTTRHAKTPRPPSAVRARIQEGLQRGRERKD